MAAAGAAALECCNRWLRHAAHAAPGRQTLRLHLLQDGVRPPALRLDQCRALRHRSTATATAPARPGARVHSALRAQRYVLLRSNGLHGWALLVPSPGQRAGSGLHRTLREGCEVQLRDGRRVRLRTLVHERPVLQRHVDMVRGGWPGIPLRSCVESCVWQMGHTLMSGVVPARQGRRQQAHPAERHSERNRSHLAEEKAQISRAR